MNMSAICIWLKIMSNFTIMYQKYVKNINNGDKLIEIEETEEINTIEKLIQKVNEIGIPIYTDNYFVKKAEIELDKILNKKTKNEKEHKKY